MNIGYGSDYDDGADRRDAERYRWLRSIDHGVLAAYEIDAGGAPLPHGILIGGHLDEAIDREIRAAGMSENKSEGAAGVATVVQPSIPATWQHDAGAYAQCSFCLRYTKNPKALSHRSFLCDCGSAEGWSGSFKKPGPDARWLAADGVDVPAEARPVPREMEQAIDAALDLHPISIRLPKALIERYKAVAAERGLIYQPLMRQALAEWIAAGVETCAESRNKPVTGA